jgi:phenylpropionate dioxygenase-like ring-hydroxylating dioxygenase large terminal subunit
LAGLRRALPASYYLDEVAFRRERERVLYREWSCAGRADPLQRPGSLQVVDVAGESVLVVRTRAGELAAHYNVWRHRGSQVMSNECYHCAGVHPELCRAVPAFKRAGAGLDWDRGVPTARAPGPSRPPAAATGRRSPAWTTTSAPATRASWSTPT